MGTLQIKQLVRPQYMYVCLLLKKRKEGDLKLLLQGLHRS